MPLEDLLELVETLRKRIGEHGQLLSQNETRTRYALIDPLLWGVGWDTEDPAQVVPEYALAPKSADYALLGSDGRPAMIVEAKRLDRPLQDGLSQSIAYCVEQGTPYFCVTDGRRWAIYETFRQVPVDKKLVVEFDLVADSPAEVCLKALALWRPSVAGGQVEVGEKPEFRESETGPPVTPPTPSQGTWVGLLQVPTKKGTSLPLEIRLPDGTTSSIDRWGAIPVEVTRWLVEREAIKPSSLPLKGSANNYILATSPVGPTGKAFRNGKQFGEIWLAPHGNIFGVLQKAQRIIEHAGLDPADFKVRLAD